MADEATADLDVEVDGALVYLVIALDGEPDPPKIAFTPGQARAMGERLFKASYDVSG